MEYLQESGWEDAPHSSPPDGRGFVEALGERPLVELRCAPGDALATLVELRCFAATLRDDLRHALLAVAVDGFDIFLANLCPYSQAPHPPDPDPNPGSILFEEITGRVVSIGLAERLVLYFKRNASR